MLAVLSVLAAGCAQAPWNRGGPGTTTKHELDGDPDARDTADPDARDTADPEALGPAPLRSQHPLIMTYLDFAMRDARTLPEGQVRLDSGVTYTSMYQESSTEDGVAWAVLDGEWVRTEFDLRVGLTDRLELFTSLPILYTTSGFLDRFIEDYHDAFGFRQDNRDNAPHDKFQVEILKDGNDVYRLKEDTLGIGDIPVGLAYAVLQEDSTIPGLLVRGALQIPTGEEKDGFGNGKLDGGIGVVVGKSLGPFTLTGGADYAWIQPSRTTEHAGVHVHDLVGGFLHGEVRLTSWLALNAALDFLSQPITGIDLRETKRDQLLLAAGGVIGLSRHTRLRFDFIEDLIADVSPDFSVRLGLDLRW